MLFLLLPLLLAPLACTDLSTEPGTPVIAAIASNQNHPPRDPGRYVRGTIVCFARWDGHVTATVESAEEASTIDLYCRDRNEAWVDWAPVSTLDDRIVLRLAEFADTRGPDRCDNPEETWLAADLTKQTACTIGDRLLAYAVFDLVTVD